ncbi:MAG: hypothetical protein IJ345_06980 [Clostridia bacterium]|nr:hypothetical protein [Clostridia bacterium]
MNYNEAYYFKILLTNGISEEYDQWLNSYLTTEQPLSDIVINLCGADINQTIAYLHNYSANMFDQETVCRMLREYLRKEYEANKLSMEEVCNLMYRFSITHGDPGDYDFNEDVWVDMFYIDECYSLAKEGVISMEKFEKAFNSYLNHGISLFGQQPPNSLLEIINKYK